MTYHGRPGATVRGYIGAKRGGERAIIMATRSGVTRRVVALATVVGILMPLIAACAQPIRPAWDDGRSRVLPPVAPASPDARLAAGPGPIPWPFEANGGQGPADAPLLLKHDPFTAAFTPSGPRLRVFGPAPDVAPATTRWVGAPPGRDVRERAPLRTTALRQELVGARPTEPVGTALSEARISYLKGDLWAPNLPSYDQIAYEHPWPGVTITYERDPRGLKSTYLVAPGADPSAMALAWYGADAVRLAEDGALEIVTSAGTLRETAPVAWQEGPDGAPELVTARWAEAGVDADGGPAWGFALGAYDPARPLVIDPLLYGTYLGGSGEDYTRSVSVDANGRAVVAGWTNSVDFNFGGAPGFDPSRNGGEDAFVVRLNVAGTALEYGTFLGGGAGDDRAFGVAVDGGGRAVVAGWTGSADFGFGGAPGFDQSHNGDTDAFVARLGTSGTTVEYGTFLGGGGGDSGVGVAVDTSGRAVVAGVTASADFGFGGAPGFDQSFNGGPFGGGDAFAARLNAAGTALEYGTYLGGSSYDSAWGVALDGSGRAVVTGDTSSSDFGFGGAPGFDQSHNGINDALVVRLNVAGTALEYGTFLGGSSHDVSYGVAVDVLGRAVVAGSTISTDFGFGGAPGFDQSHNGGTFDAYVVRLNQAGTGLEYGTFLGGSFNDASYGVAVDMLGRAVVAGQTLSNDFDFGGAPGFAQAYTGAHAFMVRLNVAGTGLDYGTFHGGPDYDDARSVALGPNGGAVVAGSSRSGGIAFGGAPGFDQSFGVFHDAFVIRDTLTANPRPAADFDADRRSDPAIYRPANGLAFAVLSGGGVKSDQFGTGPDIPVAADYDGDGKADLGIWKPASGRWFALLSGGGSLNETLGATGQVPIPADYDGDGKADLGTFNPATGAFFVKRSTGGMLAEGFGAGGLVAVPADYDADGKADLAVWRPSTGQWFALLSGGGTRNEMFGANGDIPVPADFGGDGRADLAVYRPSNGTFYVLHTNGTVTAVRVGSGNDIPVPADYDGDGRADPGIYRPTFGQFFVVKSGGGAALNTSVGNGGDVPLQQRPSLPGQYPFGPAPARPAPGQSASPSGPVPAASPVPAPTADPSPSVRR